MILEEISKILDEFKPKRKQDSVAIMAIKEAISAIRNGGWGIGAILVDNQSGKIICRGQNKTMRSDWHAEMDLLNKFEDEHQDKKARKELLSQCTLIQPKSSLEQISTVLTSFHKEFRTIKTSNIYLMHK